MGKKKKTKTLSDIIAARRERLILRGELWSLLLRTAVLVLAGGLLFTHVFLITQNSGLGMFPALKDGDLMIVFRLQQTYERDDVITYRAEGRRAVGRIVAFGGDVVDLGEDGSLTVNGAALAGEILYPTYPREEGLAYPFTVPQGCVFVLGDYRTQALDSRDYGPISLQDVEGKVITLLRRRGL